MAAMIWGMMDGDDLVGAIAFHAPISENVRKSVFGGGECWCGHLDGSHTFSEHVIELHRLVVLDDQPDTVTSWFISRGLDRLKDYKPKYWAVVSFADSTEGHDGTVYQAANADYYGSTGESVFYRDESGNLRPPRINGDNISLSDAKERGWEKERRESKHRYVFFLPDGKRHRRWIDNNCELEFEEYPRPVVTN